MPGPLQKLIGGGIGLTAEYNADRKARKAAGSRSPSPNPQGRGRSPSPQPPRSPNHNEDEESDYDEETWELDEVQRDMAPVPSSESPDAALTGEDGTNVDKVLASFFEKHPQQPPPYTPTAGKLANPVILPQRRPQMNTRGFVRAYAPVLDTCGIDQATWMDFLGGFHKAIKMSPYFHVANASIAAGALTLQIVAGPSILIHLATMAIHISVETSRRGYTRYQTNKYLDTMNEQLFKPRGLYVMIMTYKPDSASADEVVDLQQNITKAVGTRYEGAGGARQRFSSSSGKTMSELELPEAAELVFPDLDAATEEGEAGAANNKKKSHFLSNYMDHRAQAKFTAQHPDSKLNVTYQPKEFASRYSDPNHAVYQGGLVGFVSGGHVQGRRARRRQRGGLLRGPQQPTGPGAPQQRQTGLIGGLKKQLKENVLYLMVVNLPSEEEIRAAEATFKQHQQ